MQNAIDPQKIKNNTVKLLDVASRKQLFIVYLFAYEIIKNHNTKTNSIQQLFFVRGAKMTDEEKIELIIEALKTANSYVIQQVYDFVTEESE